MATAPLVILAASARGLVEAARRAGLARRFRLIAVDAFGDFETRAAADVVHPFSDLNAGPSTEAIETAIRLADCGRAPPVFLIGGGLEPHWKTLLPWCADRGQVRGPSVETLTRFLAYQQGAPAPARLLAPVRRFHGAVPGAGRWYLKRLLRAGGTGVEPAIAGQRIPSGAFAESHIDGREVSIAAFVTENGFDSRGVTVLGGAARVAASTLMSAGASTGGSGAGAALEVRDLRAIHPHWQAFGVPDWLPDAVMELARALAYEGPLGFDLIEDADGAWWLIDINLRPTATMLCLPHFAAYLSSVWPRPPLRNDGAWEVHATLWTTRRLNVLSPTRFAAITTLRVPRAGPAGGTAWLTDTPSAPALFAGGAPMCTVRASAASCEAALAAATQLAGDVARRLSSSA